MAANYNFTIPQFSTFVSTLTLKDSLGVVRDLTDYVAKMQCRYKFKGGSLLFTLTMDDGLTIDPITHVITMTISSERTGMLRDNTFYDIVLIYNDTVERILEGQLIISEGVTR